MTPTADTGRVIDWAQYDRCRCGAPAGTPCLDGRMRGPLASVTQPHKDRKPLQNQQVTATPMSEADQVNYWQERYFTLLDDHAALINQLQEIRRILDAPLPHIASSEA